MKGIKQVLCMLLGVVAFMGLTSCEEDIVKYHEEKEISRETEKDGINDIEVILDINYFFTLYVYIEDEAGNDLVGKWCNLSEFQKEYTITETCKDGNITSGLGAGGLAPKFFMIRANLAYIYKDDFVIQQFKVFKDDAEELVFRGKCIDYEWDGKGAIEYSFKGAEIPVKKKVGKTFWQNGKYYTVEDYVSPYSEITLVRHDDGTYTVKD